MKKMKYLILIGTLLVTFVFQTHLVQAKDITSSIVTNVNFKSDTTANNGQVIKEIDSGKKFILSYEFSVPKELNVLAGDKAVFLIPSEIRYNNIDMTNVPLTTNEGIVFGTATIKNGKVEITFNENVEKGVSSAYFDIWANFNTSNITTDEMNLIPFETINGTVNKEIMISKPDTGSGSGSWITKSGKYEGKQDPKDTLTWQLYINTFKDKKTFNDGYFIDTLGEGLTFLGAKESNSVRVVYGASTATATIDEHVKVEWIDDKTFKIPLRNTNERIYITYKTKTDLSKSQYTNIGEVIAKIDGSETEENHKIIGYSEKYGGEGGGSTDPSSNISTSDSSTSDSSTINSLTLPKTGENKQMPWFLLSGLGLVLLATRQIKNSNTK